MKYAINEDCFAYRNKNGEHKCDCLNDLYCKIEVCNFYKSKKQYATQLMLAAKKEEE